MMMPKHRTISLCLRFDRLVCLFDFVLFKNKIFSSIVGKPKTNEKRLVDINTVIANIERQQQQDERLR